MFAFLGMDGYQIAVIVLSIIVVVGLVKMFWRVDDKVEARRNRAADLAVVLVEEGYVESAKPLQAYSIGDISGAWNGLKALQDRLIDKETRLDVLRKPFRVQLGKAVLDPDRRLEVFNALKPYMEEGAKLIGIAAGAAAKTALPV
jgi:hypothetical protein